MNEHSDQSRVDRERPLDGPDLPRPASSPSPAQVWTPLTLGEAVEFVRQRLRDDQQRRAARRESTT